MIQVVKVKPCDDCGIKGIYYGCEDKCVQYRKWYQYQQGKEDRENELKNAFNSLFGSEYSWIEIIDKAEKLKEQNDET